MAAIPEPDARTLELLEDVWCYRELLRDTHQSLFDHLGLDPALIQQW